MIKVLVTNDDGIEAAGIKKLVEALAEYADVYVVAPKEQQSAKSHSITFLREVCIEERDMKGAAAAWAADGTPVDCIMLGLRLLAGEGISPDYIFSGINMGYNTGLAAYYSGTIGAAREGALNGIRSIALSAGSHEASHFDYILGMIPQLMEMSDRISPKTVLNVNAPDVDSWAIKGFRIAEAAPYGYGVRYVFKEAGENSYQMGADIDRADGMMRYDMDWTAEGYAAVSPLPTMLSDPVSLMRLNGQYCSARSLAVIVDAQDGMLDRIRKPKRFVKRMKKLARCLGRMNVPVLFTESFGAGSVIRAAEDYADEAEHVTHASPDPWTAPDMEKYTSLIDADRVFVAGAATNSAVLQTAIGFKERGYDVTVIEDCCSASSKRDHKAAADMMREAGCGISTCETAVMQLASCCEKPVRESVIRIMHEEDGN